MWQCLWGGVVKIEYLGVNVYDALQQRFAYIFQEFENIYVSFSGGKDSGFLMQGPAPYADEGMAQFVDILRDCGFSRQELRRMTVDNPAYLVQA